MVQIGTISKHPYHVKFQPHKLALFSKHINPSFRLPTLKCTQKKTQNFCLREEEEEETQVQPKFFFTWKYPPPLQ